MVLAAQHLRPEYGSGKARPDGFCGRSLVCRVDLRRADSCSRLEYGRFDLAVSASAKGGNKPLNRFKHVSLPAAFSANSWEAAAELLRRCDTPSKMPEMSSPDSKQYPLSVPHEPDMLRFLLESSTNLTSQVELTALFAELANCVRRLKYEMA